MSITILSTLIEEINKLNEHQQELLHKYLKGILGLDKGINIDMNKKDKNIDSNIKICPHCKSNNTVRNGKYNGKQRYICKDCRKSFSDYTHSTISYTKKSITLWLQYIKCMISGYSLRKSAEIVGINLSTSFFWRHKILDAVRRVIGSGVLEKITKDINSLFSILCKHNSLKANNNLIMSKILDKLNTIHKIKIRKKHIKNTNVDNSENIKVLTKELGSWFKRFNGIE